MPSGLITDELILLGDSTPERASIESQLQDAQTPQRLFIVAGVMDLTNYIVAPSYQVNLADGYEEWTDNNKVTHRDIVARKAKGSFDIRFQTIEEYQTFMIVMKDYKKQNGSYDCTVYCNNLLSAYTTEMYIDFDAADVMPFIGAKDYDPINITVEERANQYIRPQDELLGG